MTCEDFLMSYRTLLARAAELDDQIRESELVGRHLVANYAGERVSGGGADRDAAEIRRLDRQTELLAQREACLREAETRKQEIATFISAIGGTDARDARSRKLLRLYYCECLTLGEIRQLLRPLQMRHGKRCVNVDRDGGISETSMFRARSEALGKAERAFRRLNMG